MAILIALTVFCQAEENISRLEKKDYLPAVEKLKEAEGLLKKDDPAAAIDRINEILDTINLGTIKKYECTLRIEHRPSEYSSDPFFPLQVRGRARMALAIKDPTKGVAQVKLAIADFEASVAKGLKSSELLLDDAKKELKRLEVAIAPDPSIALKKGVAGLLLDRKYATAMKLVEEDSTVTDLQKRAIQADIRTQCDEYIAKRLAAFQKNLQYRNVEEITSAAKLSEQNFEDFFSLPEPAELATLSPALTWAREFVSVFRRLRGGEPAKLETLLQLALRSVKVEEKGENAWFRWIEGIAFDFAEASMKGFQAGAADAESKIRQRHESEASALLKTWKEFEAPLEVQFRLRHPFLADHSTRLSQILVGFPRDIERLGEYSLAGCMEAPRPDENLRTVVEELRKLRLDAGVSRDSRQRFYSLLAKASVVRLLLAGKTEKGAAEDLKGEFREPFRTLGVLDPDEFGPRVRAVLDAIKAP